VNVDRLKQMVRPIVPVALLDLSHRRYVESSVRKEAARRQRFEGLKKSVGEAVASISSLTEAQCLDKGFLENEFIPSLGLNDEFLNEQPSELSPRFGKGLHIWQYPNQLAGYLAWLAQNSNNITSYMEIGCRWGGMFILISEWIRKNGGQLRAVIAVDPIKPTPFIEAYFDLLRDRSTDGLPAIQATYLCELSTSSAVKELVQRVEPDFVFIDGDHELRGALFDHMLFRDHARIIVHHDIHSDACPDPTFLWEVLKKVEAKDFEFYEFIDQYPSVRGNFLGIGAMKRKSSFRQPAAS
jgi:hypothetical protein